VPHSSAWLRMPPRLKQVIAAEAAAVHLLVQLCVQEQWPFTRVVL
jgi:hypothetical protein